MYNQTAVLQLYNPFSKPYATPMDILLYVCAGNVLFSFIVLGCTLFNRKLTSHPYGIITLITLIETSYILLFVAYNNICLIQLPKIAT